MTTDAALTTLTLDPGTADARDIALRQRPGGSPGLFWLSGFRSDMEGSKAIALDAYGARTGHAVTRFDYSGHGASGGRFDDGTISRWLAEALAVFKRTEGPQIIVGSSMGGYLALLMARALTGSGRTLAGLVLIAPAVDMTETLICPGFSKEEYESLLNKGFVDSASQYSSKPYRYTRALIEDGRRHLLFDKVIETGCPVVILQGGQDPDVPQAHAIRLVTHILHDPVTLTLIPDGDHRLSRPEDLARLEAALDSLIERAEAG